ncbi:hypothetical protein GCM10010347_27590 [Streptomyces cirratus]|uniref:Uncharacterized protein n=1 Tax=Streptomyces cirratus TaxID=68187 RepID=A0ABQ3EUH2_9ACTN|nr:hypothetical protein GCM10010347_27590 [Streptomyces cirratus]
MIPVRPRSRAGPVPRHRPQDGGRSAPGADPRVSGSGGPLFVIMCHSRIDGRYRPATGDSRLFGDCPAAPVPRGGGAVAFARTGARHASGALRPIPPTLAG